jgi:hypothetical protein
LGFDLFAADGRAIEVLKLVRWNQDEGPDFLDAELSIGVNLVNGNVGDLC